MDIKITVVRLILVTLLLQESIINVLI